MTGLLRRLCDRLDASLTSSLQRHIDLALPGERRSDDALCFLHRKPLAGRDVCPDCVRVAK